MEVTLKTILQALNEHSLEINNRIDNLEMKMDNRIDNLEMKMNDRIDNLETKMNNRIDTLETTMNKRFDKLEKKFDGLSVELSETQETLHWVATKTLQHEQKIKALQEK